MRRYPETLEWIVRQKLRQRSRAEFVYRVAIWGALIASVTMILSVLLKG